MHGATSSPETKQLTAALAKAQSAFPTIGYDRTNDHLRSKYATFQGCCEALRKPLTENGFALPQYQPCLMDGAFVLVGVLRHVSGEFVTGIAPLINLPQQRVDRRTGEVTEIPPGMQGFGAALTYAKRQLLLCLTGAWVGEADDDGEQQAAQATDHARDHVKSMELVATAYAAIQESRERADKAIAHMKLQVHQGKLKKDVFDKLVVAYQEKWSAA